MKTGSGIVNYKWEPDSAWRQGLCAWVGYGQGEDEQHPRVVDTEGKLVENLLAYTGDLSLWPVITILDNFAFRNSKWGFSIWNCLSVTQSQIHSQSRVWNIYSFPHIFVIYVLRICKDCWFVILKTFFIFFKSLILSASVFVCKLDSNISV